MEDGRKVFRVRLLRSTKGKEKKCVRIVWMTRVVRINQSGKVEGRTEEAKLAPAQLNRNKLRLETWLQKQAIAPGSQGRKPRVSTMDRLFMETNSLSPRFVSPDDISRIEG